MMISLLVLSLLAPVDGTIELKPVFDAFVQEDHKDGQSAEEELKLGFNGDAVARSFLTFDTVMFGGKRIASATLKLWNQHSWSCQSRSWEVWAATPATIKSRWPGPALTGLHASSIETTGYGGNCADGWVAADVTTLVQEWADNKAKLGSLGLRAADEGDEFGWKRFASAEEGAHGPVLTVSYR